MKASLLMITGTRRLSVAAALVNVFVRMKVKTVACGESKCAQLCGEMLTIDAGLREVDGKLVGQILCRLVDFLQRFGQPSSEADNQQSMDDLE
jgi:hypothetical protein